MLGSTGLLGALIAITAASVLVLVLRPSLMAERGGKVFAFFGFFLLPVVSLVGGVSAHLEQSKTTDFCLSCHEMAPYGVSLQVDDAEYLPAQHFQNRRIDRDRACYTCHTDYTMFGDFNAKLRGLRHVYVHYLGTVPEKMELYTPYANRECLHCHAGARYFEDDGIHDVEWAALQANELSCLESGCHDVVHAVDTLAEAELWQPAGGEGR